MERATDKFEKFADANRKAEAIADKVCGFWGGDRWWSAALNAVGIAMASIMMFSLFAGLDLESDYYTPFAATVALMGLGVGGYTRSRFHAWCKVYGEELRHRIDVDAG